jgi:hypothetical protein
MTPTHFVPTGGTSVGTAYNLSPEGLKFLLPVTVSLAFSAIDLPSGVQPKDLAVFTVPTGATTYGYWLASTLVDATHISAQTLHFSPYFLYPTTVEWVSASKEAGVSTRVATTTSDACVVPGAAVCVAFGTGLQSDNCPTCQCSDGNDCPASGCCICPTGPLSGTSCPLQDEALCGMCNMPDAAMADGPTEDSNSDLSNGEDGGMPCGEGTWTVGFTGDTQCGGSSGSTQLGIASGVTFDLIISAAVASAGGSVIDSQSNTWHFDPATCSATQAVGTCGAQLAANMAGTTAPNSQGMAVNFASQMCSESVWLSLVLDATTSAYTCITCPGAACTVQSQ